MKLVIYNTANSRTAEDRIGRRSIRFNSVNGNMYLSLHLTKDLNVKPGDRLEFARDEDDPKAWFLRKTTDKQGFPLQSNGGGIRLHNKFVCQTVLDTVKIKGSAVFFVSKKVEKSTLPMCRVLRALCLRFHTRMRAKPRPQDASPFLSLFSLISESGSPGYRPIPRWRATSDMFSIR